METSLFFNGLRIAMVVALLGTVGIFFLRAAWSERPAESLPEDVDPSRYQKHPNLNPRANLKATSVWAVTIILSVIYIVSGVPKLGGVEYAIHQFEQWGYPHWFRQLVGGVEFFSAIMILIPRAAFYAALVLGAIMVGSVGTHLMNGEFAVAIVPMVCLAALSYVAVERHPSKLKRMA